MREKSATPSQGSGQRAHGYTGGLLYPPRKQIHIQSQPSHSEPRERTRSKGKAMPTRPWQGREAGWELEASEAKPPKRRGPWGAAGRGRRGRAAAPRTRQRASPPEAAAAPRARRRGRGRRRGEEHDQLHDRARSRTAAAAREPRTSSRRDCRQASLAAMPACTRPWRTKPWTR